MNDRFRYDRKTFLGAAAVSLGGAFSGIAAGSVPAAAAAGPGAPPPAASTPAEALALLKEGNARFAAGQSTCGPLTARRVELEAGQSPFAIVLGCSDSRVPIETVFDQIPGHLFVVRLAGNFLTEDGLGSIEYAVAALKSSFLLVLGHSSCGAVGATVSFVKDGSGQPGHIQSLVKAIEPAVTATKGQPGDWVDNAIVKNVQMNVAAATTRSTIIADAVKSGVLSVAGGIYELHSGKVRFLG